MKDYIYHITWAHMHTTHIDSTPTCIEARAHTYAHQDTMPLPQGLQPTAHASGLLSYRLPEAPYRIAQVSSDVLLHQVQQLLGGAEEVVQKVALSCLGVALSRTTQTAGTEVYPQPATQRSHLRPHQVPDSVRTVLSPPQRRSLSLRERTLPLKVWK